MVAVQAESIDPPVESEAKKLRRHFKFTEDDLELNRRGELSEKQRQRMEKLDAGGRKLGLFIGGVLILAAVLMFAFDIYLYIDTSAPFSGLSFDALTGLIPVGCGGAFSLLLAGAGIFLIVSQYIKHKPFKVLSVRGVARLERGQVRANARPYYDLYINEQQFDGDGSMPNLIQQGVEYIVYYLNTTEEIIAVERA